MLWELDKKVSNAARGRTCEGGVVIREGFLEEAQ